MKTPSLSELQKQIDDVDDTSQLKVSDSFDTLITAEPSSEQSLSSSFDLWNLLE